MQLLAVTLHFGEDRQVLIEKFPGRLQDHVDAFSRVIDEVPEYNSQAFESMPFEVEEFLGVRLDYLQENCHPLVESVI
jgi:hypothetical protein